MQNETYHRQNSSELHDKIVNPTPLPHALYSFIHYITHTPNFVILRGISEHWRRYYCCKGVQIDVKSYVYKTPVGVHLNGLSQFSYIYQTPVQVHLNGVSASSSYTAGPEVAKCKSEHWIYLFVECNVFSCRSQWPCCLKRGSWSLEFRDRGSESYSGHDVCPCRSVPCCSVQAGASAGPNPRPNCRKTVPKPHIRKRPRLCTKRRPTAGSVLVSLKFCANIKQSSNTVKNTFCRLLTFDVDLTGLTK
jgi:hypothetical protein